MRAASGCISGIKEIATGVVMMHWRAATFNQEEEEMQIDDRFAIVEGELSEAREAQARAALAVGVELDRGEDVDKRHLATLNKELRQAQESVADKEREKREFLSEYRRDHGPGGSNAVSFGGDIEYRAGMGVETMIEDNEARELRALTEKASLGRYIGTLIGGGNLDGAEAELRSGAGLAANEVPLSLFEPSRAERRAMIEHRADSSTAIANDNYAETVRMTTPYVFSRSVAPRLGIQMPQTQQGAYSAPGLTTSATASAVEKGSDRDATAVVFTPRVARPRRISARIVWRIEDQAGFGTPEFSRALRENLTGALSNEYDNQCINGNGTDPNVSGVFNQLTAPTAPTTLADFDAFVKAGASMVDGRFADSEANVVLVVGTDTYQLAASTFQSTSTYKGELSASSYLKTHLRHFSTNSKMPATDGTTKIQHAIGYRAGQFAGPTAVHPIWTRVTIDDKYSKAASGEQALTMHVLVGDKVLLVQPDAYAQLSFKVAA